MCILFICAIKIVKGLGFFDILIMSSFVTVLQKLTWTENAIIGAEYNSYLIPLE